jgi:hypothetical protein
MFVIFEFHSFDLQASVADDLQVVHFVFEAWGSIIRSIQLLPDGTPLKKKSYFHKKVAPGLEQIT